MSDTLTAEMVELIVDEVRGTTAYYRTRALADSWLALEAKLAAAEDAVKAMADPKSVGNPAWLASRMQERAERAEAQRDAATAEASRLRASLELAAGSVRAALDKWDDAPYSSLAHLDEAWAAVKDYAPAGAYSSAASDLRAALRHAPGGPTNG